MRLIQWSDATVRTHLVEQGSIPTETVRGLTVTSLARTVHDLTSVLKEEPLEQAFDSARRMRSLFPKQLDEYLTTIDQEDLGSQALRKIVAERTSPLDSSQEVTLLREALKRGLPRPIAGYSVFDEHKKFVAKVHARGHRLERHPQSAPEVTTTDSQVTQSQKARDRAASPAERGGTTT